MVFRKKFGKKSQYDVVMVVLLFGFGVFVIFSAAIINETIRKNQGAGFEFMAAKTLMAKIDRTATMLRSVPTFEGKAVLDVPRKIGDKTYLIEALYGNMTFRTLGKNSNTFWFDFNFTNITGFVASSNTKVNINYNTTKDNSGSFTLS